MNNKYGEEWRDWLTLLDVSVQKWLRGVGLAGFIDQVDSMMSIMKWIWWKIWDWPTALRVSVQKWLRGSDLAVLIGRMDLMMNLMKWSWWKRQDWLTLHGVLVRNFLGGEGLAGLISWVDHMGTGQRGRINGWGRAAGTRAPSLSLEGHQATGRGGWQQLCRWCKGTKCLCQSSRILQICCKKFELQRNTQ